MDYKEYSDNELCSMICENNEDAKNILYKKYKYIIDIIIKKYTLSAVKVGIEYNDLYQEALVGFSDALNSFNEEKNTSIQTFITVCVERRLQKAIVRAKANKNTYFLQSLSLDYEYDNNDTVTALKEIVSDKNKNDPLNSMTTQEEYNELIDKIESNLSEKEKEVFTLLIAGLTYSEIAKNLDKNLKQIDNTIQRIKAKVKKILKITHV